jgi:hypothetical protein
MHPLLQRLVAREGLEELAGSGNEHVDLVAVHRLDERVARGEVPVEGADADAGTSGDLLERDLGTLGREGLGGLREQVLAITDRVSTERTGM